MRLSTKGRYAVTAMMHIALHEKVGPVTLADISQCQGISLSYLEQLFSRLRKRTLVSSVRGPGGGDVLGRDADEIFIAEIITAVDEKVDTTRCGGKNDCQNSERCLTHDLWRDLSDRIYAYLDQISLGDLTNKRGVRQVASRQDDENRKIDVDMTLAQAHS